MTFSNIEINIDGMIGPTHHFGGLGVGNIASQANQYHVSNPREAALEGIAKMELVAGLGVPQFYLPPPARPNWLWLDSIGFSGDRRDVLRRCYDEAPNILSAAYSSAFMWTANAATVAPASDTIDSKLHVVPANLCSNLHRAQETTERRDQLRDMLCNLNDSQIHEPLPSVFALRDEGAANHLRLCSRDGKKAIHLFVYGPWYRTRFISRQTEMASRRVASMLCLRDEDCIFAEQSAQAIDAGVFHSDVVAMSNRNVLIYHERAFDNSAELIDTIRGKFSAKTGEPLFDLSISESDLPLVEAVQTYLFNSQLLSINPEVMELISPAQCFDSSAVLDLVDQWARDVRNPIRKVHYLSLNESMRNGGGPACLRLRAELHPAQFSELGNQFKVTDSRIAQLRSEVKQRYVGALCFNDLKRLDFAENAIATSHAIACL